MSPEGGERGWARSMTDVAHKNRHRNGHAAVAIPKAASVPEDMTDLVAQAVMDRLQEMAHEEAFLGQVAARVESWAKEVGIKLPLPDLSAAPGTTISRSSRDRSAQPRQLYYKYEFDQFSALKTRMLLTCLDNDSRTGGIYELDFGLNTFRQLVRCDGRGIIKHGVNYVAISRDRGVFVMNERLEVIANHPLEGLDLHGIARGPDGLLYIVESKHNRVGKYVLEPFTRVGEIVVSPDDEDRNHINDICFRDGRLLVSMFSVQEFWRKNTDQGIYDGGILEYDISDGSLINTVVRGLRMPHTLKVIGAELLYCESTGLNVVRSGTVIAQFSGYTRGLEFDGRVLYVGQSRMRHKDRNKELTLSSDAGVHLVVPEEHISRFVQIPTNDVYGLLIID